MFEKAQQYQSVILETLTLVLTRSVEQWPATSPPISVCHVESDGHVSWYT
jgi:hypothetical protein